MELTFDPAKLKRVGIEEVQPNPWNPKEKNHKKVEDIKKSIQIHGFKAPVQVRSNDGVYEIIDGEQRWTAMKELGAKEIFIYDNGEVSDEDAMNETLWWQVQVPFDTEPLANLVVHLNELKVELPYNAKEIAEFGEIAKFNYEHQDDEKPADGNDDIKSLVIKMTAEQHEIARKALDQIKQDNDDCSDARAMELLSADYLAGA